MRGLFEMGERDRVKTNTFEGESRVLPFLPNLPALRVVSIRKTGYFPALVLILPGGVTHVRF